MPDITMCKGTDCPLKKHCYRHMAKPSQLQSWFVTPPVKDDGTCDRFWDLRDA